MHNAILQSRLQDITRPTAINIQYKNNSKKKTTIQTLYQIYISQRDLGNRVKVLGTKNRNINLLIMLIEKLTH